MADKKMTTYDIKRVHSTFPGTKQVSSCSLHHVKAPDLQTAVINMFELFRLSSIDTLYVHLNVSKYQSQEEYYGLM